MSQKCSECGCESPLGQPFQHYWGCVHDRAGVKPMLRKTTPDKWPAGCDIGDSDTAYAVQTIRAALLTAPPGWKLVPVEPTPRMSAAGFCADEGHDPAGVYRAMLAAAPEVQPQPAPDPAIDLEQFRMIAQGSVDAPTQNKVYPADVSAAIGSMRQLLALIDGQGVGEGPQKGQCPSNAAPGGCQLPNRFCTFPSCDKADDLQPAACPRCKGTGEADSGGIMPWGAPATIPCDCQQPAAVTQSDSGAVSNASAPVGVEGLMQLAREWCMSWGEWAHDADPGCAKENAAEAVLRAALTQALAQQPSKGEGE